MNEIPPDELPKLAFQLAYFLHCDRKTATEIAMRALNKLSLAATAQGKRLYYRLTGRAEARKARSKVSLGEPHLLQRLVYVESEEYERRKEAAAQDSAAHPDATPARKSDLLVYFIKHLVRITTRRNSFYVTLGVSRLLYNYTTPETMELYNLVVQDPSRVHDDYYYRSRKGVLLKEMKERFGALLEVATGARGEQRWQASDDTSRHASLVRECLHQFTPWSTPCVVPERFDPLSETIDQLNFQGRLADEEHEVEVNRIHATLHPECFARLAAANQLATPDERLELPLFSMSDEHDDTNSSSRTPPNLSPDDLNTINDLLAHEASRRKAASATFFRVLVDGRERAETTHARSTTAHLRVDEGAEIIEVYGEDQEGSLLLATYLLNFADADEQGSVITVEGGQQISFTTKLLRDDTSEITGADVVVTCKETPSVGAAARTMFASLMGTRGRALGSTVWRKPAGAFAVLALLCVGGWWLWSNRQKPQDRVVYVTPTPAPTSEPTYVPKPEVAAGPKERPSPSTSPANHLPRSTGAVAPPQLAENGVKHDRDETAVESTIVTDAAGDDAAVSSGVRSWDREVMGKPLREVRLVYLQTTGDNSANQELLAQLRTKLSGNGKLEYAGSDAADAALKISVRPASLRAEEERVIVIVKAVNANGYVVWPAARRSSSRRYVGRPRYVAERIVADLARDIEGAR